MSEQVYDEQIAPLVTQLIGICQEHGIGMAASFQYVPADYDPNNSEEGTDNIGVCDTLIPPKGMRGPCYELTSAAIRARGKGMALSRWIMENMDKLAPEVFGIAITTEKS